MLLGILIGAVGGFIAGVLVGRRNKNKVEAAVKVGEGLLSKASGGKL